MVETRNGIFSSEERIAKRLGSDPEYDSAIRQKLDLQQELTRAMAEIARLRGRNDALTLQSTELRNENVGLQAANVGLQDDNVGLRDANAGLRNDNAVLRNANAGLTRRNEALEADHAELIRLRAEGARGHADPQDNFYHFAYGGREEIENARRNLENRHASSEGGDADPEPIPDRNYYPRPVKMLEPPNMANESEMKDFYKLGGFQFDQEMYSNPGSDLTRFDRYMPARNIPRPATPEQNARSRNMNREDFQGRQYFHVNYNDRRTAMHDYGLREAKMGNKWRYYTDDTDLAMKAAERWDRLDVETGEKTRPPARYDERPPRGGPRSR